MRGSGDRIVGPSGSKRKRRFLALVALAALAALALAVNSFGTGQVGTASGFEDDDGNLADDAPLFNPATGAGDIDWNNFDPVSWQTSPSTTPTREAEKTAFGWQFKGLEDWQSSTSDSGFGGGTKQDNMCPDVITAKAPNKDDLKRIYMTSKTGSNGHTYLNLAWVRIGQNAPSPSAHVAFEFNKGEVGSCNETGGLAARQAGDMLIVYDFGGGDVAPIISLERWITSGTCEIGSHVPPCWGEAATLPAGTAEAKVNTTGSVVDALAPPALSSTTGTSVDETLGTKEFGEVGIDLTNAGVFAAGTCETFGTASAVSRTSGSDDADNAAMKDLVGPTDFSLTNCGELHIVKQTVPAGISQNFSYTATKTTASFGTCTPDSDPASFTLNDGAAATDSEDCVDVPAGSYTVTEGANPSGFAFTDLSCTASGTGTSATPTGPQSATKTASITMAGGGVVTCTYTNTQLVATSLSNQRWLPNDRIVLNTTGGATLDGTLTATLYRGTFSGTAADCTAGSATSVYTENIDTSPGGVPSAGGTAFNTNNTSVFVGTKSDGTAGEVAGNYFWLIHYVDANIGNPKDRCEASTISITD